MDCGADEARLCPKELSGCGWRWGVRREGGREKGESGVQMGWMVIQVHYDMSTYPFRDRHFQYFPQLGQ